MTGKQCFKVCFWGVRGSYPTPGPNTLRHGGNTSCIEVQVATHTLIFDAGSGIIRLGNDLMQRAVGQALHLALFITHGHGDHLVGFPFFVPLYEAQANIACFGPQLAGMSIEQVVTRIMSPPYFPVDIHDLPSQRTFHTITGREQIVWRDGNSQPRLETRQAKVEDSAVRVFAQITESHPLDGAALYRIEYAGHSVVYATDVEWGEQCDPQFLAFAEGAARELVVDGTTGFLVEDERAMAGAIGRLSLIAARDCRAWVAAHCDVDVVAGAYERIYRSVASPRARQIPARV